MPGFLSVKLGIEMQESGPHSPDYERKAYAFISFILLAFDLA